MKKLISISIPCRNEVENIEPLCEAIDQIFRNDLPDYDYVIQFIDNASDDGTREAIEKVCKENPNVCAIYNVKNFGSKSGAYGFLQTGGDCTITLAADFQEPVELIPQMVKRWENGAKIVCAVKTASQENKIMFLLRTIYYKLLKKLSGYSIIEHFTGFGLYDHSFVDFLRELKDPIPYIRGMVAEFGYNISTINFVQPKRKHGKSKHNLYSLYATAMESFANLTKVIPRIATLIGCLLFFIALTGIVACTAFGLVKDAVSMDALLILVILLTGSIQLFFIGVLGEYILSINERLKNRPFVIEEKRINMEIKRHEK